MARAWPAVRVTIPESSPTGGPENDVDLPAEERLLLQLDDLRPSALEDAGPAEWVVHFSTVPDMAEVSARLREAFGTATRCVLEWLPDENWAARTQAQLKSVTVGRLIVAPPWDVPATVERGQLVIEIEPSTGFGTGHHQSTRLCLHAMQREARSGFTMLDVGTGSGVLAIAAVLLGCARGLAIDSDPDACRAARDNVVRNRVDARVEVLVEGLGERHRMADLVLANLTADVICQHAATLREMLKIEGRLIVSGIMSSQRPLVEEALQPLIVTAVDEEEGWVAITLKR